MLRKTISQALIRAALALDPGRAAESVPVEEYRRVQGLLDQQSKLEELGIIAGRLAHDIMSPLTGVAMDLELLRRRLPSDPKLSELAERMRKEIGALRASVSLINAFRMDADFYRQRLQPADLSDLVFECVRSVQKESRVKPEDLYFRYERSPFVTARILADPSQLRLAVTYIIKNAARSALRTHQGRGLVMIKIRGTRGPARFARVEVSDSGPGVPEEQLPLLASMSAEGGTGVFHGGFDLFLAGRIIGLHGGELKFEGKDGAGLTVSVILPLVQDRRGERADD